MRGPTKMLGTEFFLGTDGNRNHRNFCYAWRQKVTSWRKWFSQYVKYKGSRL